MNELQMIRALDVPVLVTFQIRIWFTIVGELLEAVGIAIVLIGIIRTIPDAIAAFVVR